MRQEFLNVRVKAIFYYSYNTSLSIIQSRSIPRNMQEKWRDELYLESGFIENIQEGYIMIMILSKVRKCSESQPIF